MQRLSVKPGPSILALIAIALIVAAIVLFLVLIGGNSDSSQERRPEGIPPTASLAAEVEFHPA